MNAPELLARVHACATALSRGDAAGARKGLLRTCGELYHLARCAPLPQRQQHLQLAGRFYRQAMRLEDISHLPRAASRPVFGNDEPPSRHDTPPAPRLIGLDDVAGCEAVKAIFRAKFIYPRQHPDRAARYRQSGAGGVLLYGSPGTGKTFLSSALAGALGIPVFAVKPAELVSKWQGESEKQVAALFTEARSHESAMIFLDEIDTLTPSRDGDESNGAMRRLLAQILTELDGFSHHDNRLLFVGATNRPWDVDAALLRVGRFDALAYVPLPDAATRTALLHSTLTGLPLADDLGLEERVTDLDGYSAAEVCAVALLAAQRAFLEAVESGRDIPLARRHLLDAQARVHRAATPAMLQRFDRFAHDHGLAPDAEPDIEPLRQVQARDLSADTDVLPIRPDVTPLP